MDVIQVSSKLSDLQKTETEKQPFSFTNNFKKSEESGKKEKIFLFFFSFLSFILFGLIFYFERELKLRRPEVFLAQPFRPANIEVRADRSFGSLPQVWRAFSQGGEEAAGVRMLEPVVNFLKKINIDYIRIDHIYDDDYYGVVRGRKTDGTLDLDWSKLDLTVKDITDSGAKPFFSLTYLPQLVGPGKIGRPNNWADWQDLVRQTVEHFSQNIDNVYYEVWNEPSLEWFGGWKMYGEKDYRQLYYFAVQGAKQAKAVKSFKIGGPAIPVLDINWIRLLFDYCLAYNLPLDFISWHRYHYHPEQFINDVYQINVLLSQPKYQRFRLAEKIITEWGPNSEKDTAYSSSVAASHAVAVIRQMLDKVNYLFAFEIKDGPNQGQEAWGLLTHQLVEGGVKEKPRYFLYEWLNDFQGSRLEVLGEGTQISAMAVSDNRTLTLILANYAPGQGSAETFPIIFTGLKNGRYRLFKQKLFNQPLENEISIEQGSLELQETLAPYEVMRIKIQKLGS